MLVVMVVALSIVGVSYRRSVGYCLAKYVPKQCLMGVGW